MIPAAELFGQNARLSRTEPCRSPTPTSPAPAWSAMPPNLGLAYQYGRGVRRDHEEAVQWYRRAAEEGQERGQYRLGLMYENGRGVRRDRVEAVRWYRLAAEQGDADAQEALDRLR